MALSDSSVSDYIAKQPKPVQALLKRVRSIIRAAVPGATEVISYQIPTYKLPTGTAVYFAAWKTPYSIYPATDGVAEKFKKELTPYKVTKGTIRFPLSEPVPAKLIERIVKFRAEAVVKRANARWPRRG